MNHFGITPDQPESILQFGPADMICSICNTFKSELSAPLLLLSGLLAVTAVSTLLSGTGDCIPQMKTDLSRVSALIIAGSTAAPLLHCLQRTAETLHEGEILMTGFVPVFSGFLAAGGTVTGASTYQLLILFLTELIMQLTNGIFLPLIHSAAALGITDAINPSLHLTGFVRRIRSAVNWMLAAVMTLFAAILSIRSFIASAADSVGAKTVKFLSTSLIPIIGPAVSETYASISGSIRLVGSGVGSIGILAILFMILPPVISITIYRIVFRICSMISEFAESTLLKKLFDNASAVLSSAAAMLICYAVMLVFSTALMLMLCCRS